MFIPYWFETRYYILRGENSLNYRYLEQRAHKNICKMKAMRLQRAGHVASSKITQTEFCLKNMLESGHLEIKEDAEK